MHHFFSAISTLLQPQYRKYILVPLLVNFILFIILTSILVAMFSDLMTVILDYVPSWLHFMASMLWFIFGIAILIIYGLSFTFISNLIAAPFNGFLAEKIQIEHGIPIAQNESTIGLISRTLWREVIKISYFIAYGLLVMILLFFVSFIPILNLAIPVLAFLWSSWCIAIQYMDYAADNYQQEFNDLRKMALKPTFHTFSFGGGVSLLSMIPVVNIFVMPIAVAAGTQLWIKDIHPNMEMKKPINLNDI